MKIKSVCNSKYVEGFKVLPSVHFLFREIININTVQSLFEILNSTDQLGFNICFERQNTKGVAHHWNEMGENSIPTWLLRVDRCIVLLAQKKPLRFVIRFNLFLF